MPAGDIGVGTCVVSGSGNVAIFAIEKIHQLGGTVVACSDSTGYVTDPNGIDLDVLKELKLRQRGRISAYAEQVGTARFVSEGSIWDVPCQVALPCATQNELTRHDAHTLLDNGVMAVVEGANMSSTPEAVELFTVSGTPLAPGKAANAGGVATSTLEMQQNACRNSWSFSHTEQRLSEIMTRIHDTCYEAAAAYGSPGSYVLGANVTGFLRVRCRTGAGRSSDVGRSRARGRPCEARRHVGFPGGGRCFHHDARLVTR